MIEEIYFDNNATTPLSPDVKEAMCIAVYDCFGNPSSQHRAGEKTRRAIASARSSVAELLHVPVESIVFGSGVTELNNWVINSLVNRSDTKHLIVSEVEHSSVLKAAVMAEARGAKVSRIPVDENGLVDLAALEALLLPSTTLVSVQWVNNETGVIQPIGEISKMCSRVGVPLHCDAAQAAGKLRLSPTSASIDFLTVSAHKMHGPTGIAAIALGRRNKLTPFFWGGQQEFGLRPGTENVLGIIGFGVAAAIRNKNLDAAIERMSSYRDVFETSMKRIVPEIQVNGSQTNRVCNTTNLRFSNLDGQALVALLDRDGVRCSQTSACDSNRPEPSHVLTAMGLTETEAYSSVRFSFSDQNTVAEVDLATAKLLRAIEQLTGQSLAFSREMQESKHEV